jgi:H+/gluconate symporter-like permease
MTLFILLSAIVLLVLLITVVILHAFIAFLIVCIATGLARGMEVSQIMNAVQKGIGDIMGSCLSYFV